MKTVTIARLTKSKADPTLGCLLIEGNPFLTTLELPWLDNQQGISCIPPGSYTAKRAVNVITGGGLKIPTTFRLQGVPNRSGILFHVGNFPRDTNGCILVGRSFGAKVVLSSREAFELFLRELAEEDEIAVVIKELL